MSDGRFRTSLTAVCVVCLWLSGAADTARGQDAQPAPEMPAYGAWRSSRIGGGGYLQNVVFCPSDPSRLYCYVDVSGPYRSDDGGRSWRMLQGNLPARRGNFSTRGLSVDPRDADRIVIAVGSSWDIREGIYVSNDGGRTFEKTLDASFVSGEGRAAGFILARDPGQPDTIYAAATDTGVHRSDDGGRTWTKLGPDGLDPSGLVIDRSNPRRLWLSTRDGKQWVHRKHNTYPGGFFRSNDGGQTWDKLVDAGPQEILQDPLDSARLYGTFGKAPKLRLSTDGGQTWDDFTAGIDPNRKGTWKAVGSFNALAAGPDFVLAADADGHFYRMPAGTGDRWEPIERQGVDEGDWYASMKDAKPGEWTHFGKALGSVSIDPRDPDHWFFTDWYAIYETRDAGRNWKLAIHGIEVTVIHCLLQDPTDPRRVHLGMADNGYFYSDDAGTSFKHVKVSSNIKDLSLSPKDVNRLYAVGPSKPGAWQSNLVLTSKDRGRTWNPSPMTDLPDMDKLRCNTIAVDPNDPMRVFLAVSGKVGPGAGGVYRSDDGGTSWRWAGEGLAPGVEFFRSDIWSIGREMAVSVDGSMVAFSRDRDLFYRFDLGTERWEKCDLSLSGDVEPQSVAADWHRPGFFYAGVRGAGVFVTEDAGRSWRRTLPGSATHITVDRAVPGRAAASTDDGVALTRDGGQTWTVLDRALPERVQYNMGAFAGDRLVVGSGGSGVFWIDVPR